MPKPIVLVVEDDIDLREALLDTLAGSEFIAVAAEDGEAALRARELAPGFVRRAGCGQVEHAIETQDLFGPTHRLDVPGMDGVERAAEESEFHEPIRAI